VLIEKGQKKMSNNDGNSNNKIGEERLLHRLELRKEERFIVDKILPAGCLHLLGGPSGVGKTTWLFQQLKDWSEGKPILGYQSFPCNWLYVSADRSALETDRTLRRLGLGDWPIPMYSIEEVSSGDPDLLKLHQRFPHIDLFVIEGIQAFVPDTKGSQNKADMLWVMKLRQHLLGTQKTITGTTHMPKGTGGQSGTGDRTDFLGSASLLACCSTLINFEYPDDVKDSRVKVESDERKITIKPRDTPNIVLNYTRSSSGSFILADSDEAQALFALEIMLASHKDQEPITKALLADWVAKSGISKRSLSRFMSERLEQGKLEKISDGAYQKRRVN
jgi:RecA-family ATPase